MANELLFLFIGLGVGFFLATKIFAPDKIKALSDALGNKKKKSRRRQNEY